MYFVAWSIASPVLAGIPLLLPFTHFHKTWGVLALSVFVAALAVSFLVEQRFGLNLQAEVWSEVELAPTRDFMLKPFWKGASAALMTIWAVAFMYAQTSLSRESTVNVAFWIFVSPLWTIIQVRRLLAPPPESEGGLLHLRNAEPLRSEHWGAAGLNGPG